MNIKSTFPALLILLAATIIAPTQPSSAITPDHGPSAFGQGQFRYFTELVDFSFEVRANKNGNAHGRAVFEYLSTQTRVVVKIDCLRIDSSDALMTGSVLQSDDPDFPKSTNVVFAAIDGETQDYITPLFMTPFSNCSEGGYPLTMFPLSADAIQVNP